MKILNSLATLLNQAIWVVGLFTILHFAQERWPTPYFVVSYVLLGGATVWYAWSFLGQPFLKGLREDGE